MLFTITMIITTLTTMPNAYRTETPISTNLPSNAKAFAVQYMAWKRGSTDGAEKTSGGAGANKSPVAGGCCS